VQGLPSPQNSAAGASEMTHEILQLIFDPSHSEAHPVLASGFLEEEASNLHIASEERMADSASISMFQRE